MPDMTPVGNMYPPMNPIAMLGGVQDLAIKRQTLQLQNQELQRSQVQTQQAQGVNQFFSSWTPGDHHGADGTVDIDSAHKTPDYQNLPGVAKIAVDKQLNDLRGQQLDNKVKLSGLNSDVVGQFGKMAQAASQDPTNAQSMLQTFAQQGPDQQRIAQIYGPLLQKTDPKHLPSALSTMGAQAQDVTAQQAQTNPAPTTNAAGNILMRKPATGALSAPPGAPPGSALNPSSPAVAAATTQATGGANIDVNRASQVTGLQQASAAAIPQTQRIDQLAHEIGSGHLAKMISESGNYLGFSDINQARSQLNKDLGQVKALATQNAGSDSRAATILEGYPTDTTPESTIHAAMDYIRGTARQNLARGQLLQKNGTQGFQAADDMLTRTTNPLMHEYVALPAGQPNGFFKRNFGSPQEAQAFKQQAEALKKHSSLLGTANASGQ